MPKHNVTRQAWDALRTRNGLTITEFYQAPIGSPVLVYRLEQNKWKGLFPILNIRGEDVIVLTQ